jgi:hypothetical protein
MRNRGALAKIGWMLQDGIWYKHNDAERVWYPHKLAYKGAYDEKPGI